MHYIINYYFIGTSQPKLLVLIEYAHLQTSGNGDIVV